MTLRTVSRTLSVALLVSYLAGQSFAIPVLTVLPPVANAGNVEWTVLVAPDASLFMDTPVGLGSSLDVELGFTTDSTFVSASKNAADWSFDNPGNNPFTNSVTFGVQQTANDVFASLGSTDILTTASPVTVLSIVTAGTATTTLNWGGQTFLAGTINEYIGSRIAQDVMNFDGYTGSMMYSPAGVDGDFNNDGNYDCADIDALVAEIAAGTNNGAFDMNGDGSVNLADVEDAVVGWLAVGGANNPDATGGNAFLVGDATLDGTVDGADFLRWNNTKFTAVAAWCSGDFNADGSVDGADFLRWNNNKFTSSDAAVTVPEPAGIILLGLAGVLLLRRRG